MFPRAENTLLGFGPKCQEEHMGMPDCRGGDTLGCGYRHLRAPHFTFLTSCRGKHGIGIINVKVLCRQRIRVFLNRVLSSFLVPLPFSAHTPGAHDENSMTHAALLTTLLPLSVGPCSPALAWVLAPQPVLPPPSLTEAAKPPPCIWRHTLKSLGSSWGRAQLNKASR